MIDGRSASGPGRTYGVFEVGVRPTAGQTTPLGYTVWMPRIDTAHAVTIPTHTATELVITTPRIPGLELHLPAHSGIRAHEGTPATEISITPIPLDRPPFPLPQGVAPPAYFTIQLGAGYVYARDRLHPRPRRGGHPDRRDRPPGRGREGHLQRGRLPLSDTRALGAAEPRPAGQR